MLQSARGLMEDALVKNTEKHVFKAAAATLAVYEQKVKCDTTDAAFTLVLPPVAQAKGRQYSIFLDAGETNAVTLTDYPNATYNDSQDWAGDFTLDAADDFIVLESDGEIWTVVENRIA